MSNTIERQYLRYNQLAACLATKHLITTV